MFYGVNSIKIRRKDYNLTQFDTADITTNLTPGDNILTNNGNKSREEWQEEDIIAKKSTRHEKTKQDGKDPVTNQVTPNKPRNNNNNKVDKDEGSEEVQVTQVNPGKKNLHSSNNGSD